LAVVGTPATAQWTGAPSPHDKAHLAVVRGADFRNTDGKAGELKAIVGAAAGKAITVSQPLVSKLHVRYPGEYVLWIRVGGPPKGPVALKTTIHLDQQEIMDVTVNAGRGEADVGGPD